MNTWKTPSPSAVRLFIVGSHGVVSGGGAISRKVRARPVFVFVFVFFFRKFNFGRFYYLGTRKHKDSER